MFSLAHRLLAASLIAATLTATSPAHAQDDPPPAPPPAPAPAFQLTLNTDGPLLLLSAALTASFLVTPELSGVRCAPTCNRADINAFDRPAAGLYSATWNIVGDAAVVGTILLAPIMVLADEGLGPGLQDAVVLLEAVGGASALQVVTAFAVERPRPRVYGSDAPLADRTDANAARSFFSGHTADTMASVVAGARAFQRLQRPGMAIALLIAGGAGTALVGTSRVLAGSHFPSDVIAGAAVGTAFGIAMPALHDTPVRLTATAPGAAAGVSLIGGF